ncbi:MAG: sodium:calcium antiporter [Calditrichaeota bacterium]|nr:MAG: sodium:calcium antiporter [Calditrichota bacterium]
MILKELLLLFGGLGLIWGGAEVLVRYASRLARSMGVSPLVIGLTIISVGTSIPELVVCVMAAIQKEIGISIGNIVGSNIANLGLILGVGAMITPLVIHTRWVKKEVPFMIAVTILFVVMGLTGKSINRVEGIILLGFLSVALFYVAKFTINEITEFQEIAREEANGISPPTITPRKLLYFFLTLVGLALLIAGSKIAVDSGSTLARLLGVSNTIIGLTLIAIGTSLPELATTIVSAFRKEADLALGNVIGSNIVNITLIGGVTATIHPIPVTEEFSMLMFDFGALIFLTLLVWPLMKMRQSMNRYEGVFLLFFYAAFLMLSISFSQAPF